MDALLELDALRMTRTKALLVMMMMLLLLLLLLWLCSDWLVAMRR